MTQKDKELLFKDLCARLPYHIIVNYRGANVDLTLYIRSIKLEDCKPYLRPLSSMTEEEKKELSSRYVWKIDGCGQIQIRYHSEGSWDDDTDCPTEEYLELFGWLNAHHFDYRGLIDKGLALEAPEGMYDFKK